MPTINQLTAVPKEKVCDSERLKSGLERCHSQLYRGGDEIGGGAERSGGGRGGVEGEEGKLPTAKKITRTRGRKHNTPCPHRTHPVLLEGLLADGVCKFQRVHLHQWRTHLHTREQ